MWCQLIWKADPLSKIAIIGWIVCTIGTALWIYGYFASGHASLIDWNSNAPWWIAEFLPNIESEAGMVLAIAGTALTYWPARPRE